MHWQLEHLGARYADQINTTDADRLLALDTTPPIAGLIRTKPGQADSHHTSRRSGAQPVGHTDCAVGYAASPFGVIGGLHQGVGMSGRKFSFEINRTSSAPAATLFRLVADGGNWSKWARPVVLQSSWARQGDPAPGGVGAVRKFGAWPLLVQEETVVYEQDRRHAYKMVGPPSPAKDYVGEVVLTPNAAGGTDIRWTGSFIEGAPGTGPVMRAALGGAVRFFADRLAKAAERESNGGR